MLGSQSPSLRVLRHVSWACLGSKINGGQGRFALRSKSASLSQNLTLQSLLTRTPCGEVGPLISIRGTTLRERAQGTCAMLPRLAVQVFRTQRLLGKRSLQLVMHIDSLVACKVVRLDCLDIAIKV